MNSPIRYRGYTIERMLGANMFQIIKGDDYYFDGEHDNVRGHAYTIESAKEEVDALLSERQRYIPESETSYRGYIIRNEWFSDDGTTGDYYIYPEGKEEKGIDVAGVTFQGVKDVIDAIRAENPEVFIVRTNPAKSLGPNLTKIVGWRHEAELFADKVNGVVL